MITKSTGSIRRPKPLLHREPKYWELNHDRMSRWLKIIVEAAKGWSADNAFKHSAAVSFYTLFSLAPVTVIAITVMSVFLGEDAAARQFSTQMTELVGPASTQMVRDAAKAAESPASNGLTATIGVILLLVGATTVFAQLQNSLNEIWGVRARPSRNGIVVLIVQRLLSFAMVLTIGFLLLVSLVLTTWLTAVLSEVHGQLGTSPAVVKSVDFGVSLLVISVLFALIFKVIPDVRLKWRDVWPGAFLTALLFGIGRYAIALYLGHSTVASIYGTAGSLVAMLIWVYYSCMIFFFGVEFTRAHHLSRNHSIQPKKTAVLVEREVVIGRAG
jgi:membrane protein